MSAAVPHAPHTAAAAPIAVIGAGLAGWTTVRELRKLDANTPVVVVTADAGDFYAKPSLSNAFAQQRTPAQLVTTPAAAMAQTLNVTLLAHTAVERIDLAQHCLHLRPLNAAAASEPLPSTLPSTLPFSQLVLATGAQPVRAPVQGNAAQHIRVVNSLEDFAGLHAALQSVSAQGKPPRLLLVGAGLIGCEFANDLVHAGYAVHVVDPSPRPLAALLPEAAGLQLRQALQQLGIHWHLGHTLQALHSNDAATPLQATLSDGTALEVDIVLSAIGLRADTRLAQAAGLACERGIVVNTRLQTSAPHVFALGDCAQYESAGQRTLPYVMPLMNAAKALAANLAGQPTELSFPLMPVSIKTPALPIVVAAAHPAQSGEWVADEAADAAQLLAGTWRFLDAQGQQRGFALTGAHTAQRMALSKTTLRE